MKIIKKTKNLDFIAATTQMLADEPNNGESDRDSFSRLLNAAVPRNWPPKLLEGYSKYEAENMEADPNLYG
jgi:hypothetical protein